MSARSGTRLAQAAVTIAGLLGILALGSGCAAQVYRREHLVDPIMSFDAEAKANARRMKALEAREGSTGGIGGAFASTCWRAAA